MLGMLSSSIGRLRAIGIIEGLSYLLLVGVAMPMKYMMGQPEMVTMVGRAHGMLFLVFCLALFQTFMACDWSLKRAAVIFAAAVLPFGPFVVDGSLKREQEERAASTSEPPSEQ